MWGDAKTVSKECGAPRGSARCAKEKFGSRIPGVKSGAKGIKVLLMTSRSVRSRSDRSGTSRSARDGRRGPSYRTEGENALNN